MTSNLKINDHAIFFNKKVADEKWRNGKDLNDTEFHNVNATTESNSIYWLIENDILKKPN